MARKIAVDAIREAEEREAKINALIKEQEGEG
jgi:hypothetical protein